VCRVPIRGEWTTEINPHTLQRCLLPPSSGRW
jgi:hypothetical protein